MCPNEAFDLAVVGFHRLDGLAGNQDHVRTGVTVFELFAETPERRLVAAQRGGLEIDGVQRGRFQEQEENAEVRRSSVVRLLGQKSLDRKHGELNHR